MLLIVDTTIHQRNSKDLNVIPLPSGGGNRVSIFASELWILRVWIPNPGLGKSGIRPLTGLKTPKFLNLFTWTIP